MSGLHLLDFVVIGGYFVVLLWIGVWAARREKVLSSDYFLYLQSLQAYIAPPIAACFLFGRVADLTYHTASVPTAAEDDPSKRRTNVVASALLAVLIGVLWIAFR